MSTPSDPGSQRTPPSPRIARNAPGATSWSIQAHGFAGRYPRKDTGPPDPGLSSENGEPRSASTSAPRRYTLRRVAAGSTGAPTASATASSPSRPITVTVACTCARAAK
ncbi:hypothetical protein [Curtobacterium sp. P97]|uniref:hypothetical protein n=1 Tax=Curtobacterium sp. P97 TaxID=2939562 RepID=UPI00203C87C2|nr:hypothetical protein [Curtobacterium sp. P97]MCM3522360.1 hypothetical protein [Curtobacterium sp. P97]